MSRVNDRERDTSNHPDSYPEPPRLPSKQRSTCRWLPGRSESCSRRTSGPNGIRDRTESPAGTRSRRPGPRSTSACCCAVAAGWRRPAPPTQRAVDFGHPKFTVDAVLALGHLEMLTDRLEQAAACYVQVITTAAEEQASIAAARLVFVLRLARVARSCCSSAASASRGPEPPGRPACRGRRRRPDRGRPAAPSGPASGGCRGYGRVTPRRCRRFAPGAGRRGRCGGRTPRSCGP